MALKACGNEVPLLTNCPEDSEQILFFNVSGQPTGMALRTWAKVKCCLLQQTLGTGIISITGSQLDSEGVYLNSDLIDDLLVFATNIPNFLIEESQWDYVLNGDNEVVGIQILIGYLPDDIFIIFPNPQTNC